MNLLLHGLRKQASIRKENMESFIIVINVVFIVPVITMDTTSASDLVLTCCAIKR